MKIVPLFILSIFLLFGCTEKQALDEANAKIAELQSQLELEKSKSTTATKLEVPASEILPTTVTEPTLKPETISSGAQWEYAQNEDKMSGGKTYYAYTLSTNTVDFDFPYSGEQHATLSLRDDPRQGKDVIFRIEKGQILCNSYEDCTVLVRFDDEKSTNFSAVGAADNSTETIFIRNHSKFVAKMLKAKLVRVSTNIHQEGSPVFEFNVNGFDQNRFKPKS